MQSARLAALAAVIVVAGCATFGGAPVQNVSVESIPAGATVTVADGQSCTTPCAVKAKAYEPMQITFRKSGCLTQTQLVVPEPSGIKARDGGWVGSDWTPHGLMPDPVSAQLNCDDGAPAIARDQTASAS